MPYVDDNYYLNTFHGEPVDPADFPSLSMRAEELVEEMTMYRLNAATFQTMSEDIQQRVKNAVCAQIEYLDVNGGSDMDNGAELQSAGIGKFHYSMAAGPNGSTTQSAYAPRALRILMPTGLLYRGGGGY